MYNTGTWWTTLTSKIKIVVPSGTFAESHLIWPNIAKAGTEPPWFSTHNKVSSWEINERGFTRVQGKLEDSKFSKVLGPFIIFCYFSAGVAILIHHNVWCCMSLPRSLCVHLHSSYWQQEGGDEICSSLYLQSVHRITPNKPTILVKSCL